MEAIGRKGLTRLLSGFGFKEVATVVQRSID